MRCGSSGVGSVAVRRRKRIGPFERKPLTRPSAVNRSWSMDFVCNGLGDGRTLRCLVIAGALSREPRACQAGVGLNFIRLGKPVESAYIENFNGRFQGECLNEYGFLTMAHASASLKDGELSTTR